MISSSEIKIRKTFIPDIYDLRYKHSYVNMGIGQDKQEGKWATVYLIETEPKHQGQGEATAFLERLKYDAERMGYKFALWCPMSPAIKHICKKLGIETV